MMKWLVFCAISLPSILLRRETNSLFLPFFVRMCTLVARISSQPLQSALPILLSTQPSCNTYCVRFLLLLSLQCNRGCNFFFYTAVYRLNSCLDVLVLCRIPKACFVGFWRCEGEALIAFLSESITSGVLGWG
jgi:hypothetical protein